MYRLWLWLTPVIAYIGFAVWYTNLAGPMTPGEIDSALGQARANGADAANLGMLEQFMREDTGRQFIMVNLLDLNPAPPVLPATGPGAAAPALLNHYMEHMYPALFSRASHPVFMGVAVHQAMDVTGIEGAEVWGQAALMRYRSRRDLVAIATDPRFNDRHEYKLAALTKTIAIPVESGLYLSDPRFLLALILICLTALIDLFVPRRVGTVAQATTRMASD